MAQQTAVEYLKEKLMYLDFHPNTLVDVLQWIEQAKQMEKEQLIENNKLKAIVEFYEQGCGKEGCKVKEPHVH